MYQIENLKYKQILNIDRLTIDQPIACITGPSGAGKSTLLRMLNKLSVPDSGTILYNGTDIKTMNAVELRRKATMLSQTTVMYGLSLREELQVGLRFRKEPDADDEALKKVLKLVRLEKNLDEDCLMYSGGEKQRVCLARVLLTNAETLLMDEPSAALDTETETDIVEVFEDIAKNQKKQIIMITHSDKIVEKFKDSLIYMENGKVVR